MTWRAVGYGVLAAAVASVGVLLGQVQLARREIPRAQAPPPRADGRYGGRPGREPLTLVTLGDSCAAGLGVEKRRETPGALLANGISRRLGRPVQLHCRAVVGATSRGLAPQLADALELRPDLAVIIVGANDVTHRTDPGAAVRHLARAVRELRATGAEVVVGTCPDMGAIRPIRPPLRWLARQWSRRLAAAQALAVRAAGGTPVALGDLLGSRFVAEPHRMFARDRFHPSAHGYAAVVGALLPPALAALRSPPALASAHAGFGSPPEALDRPGLRLAQSAKSVASAPAPPFAPAPDKAPAKSVGLGQGPGRTPGRAPAKSTEIPGEAP